MSRFPHPSRAVSALLVLSLVLAVCAAPNDIRHSGSEAPRVASAAPGYLFLSPNTDDQMRKRLGKLIDQGLTDRQIFTKLLDEEGPGLLQPHLLP